LKSAEKKTVLLKMAAEKNPAVRMMAVQGLKDFKDDPQVKKALTGLSGDPDKDVAALAKEEAIRRRPAPLPACLILGGETTVTLRGNGKGGRNQELALSAALAIRGVERVAIASLGTDGSDGPTDAAGGLVDGTTVSRGEKAGLAAEEYLENNDSYHFLDAVGDLLRTGPTRTNVNDLVFAFVWSEGF
jgi:glycerate-2-kinase